MNSFWDLMRWPAIASLVMSPVHCLFGLHIVRRGLIFIDLAVAQMAALGMAVALSRGLDVESTQAYQISIMFALGGALLISLTRFRLGRVPHEAMIGIIFVVGSALSILFLDNSPHGPEELKSLLDGSILLVSPDHVKQTAVIYGIILAVLIVLWKPISRVTENHDSASSVKSLIFDFLFYALLGFVVASSVRIAGMLVVFTWLVMPAASVFFWIERMGVAIAVALPLSFLGSLTGLYLSWKLDWPTGAGMVVAMTGIVALFYLSRVIGALFEKKSISEPQ